MLQKKRGGAQSQGKQRNQSSSKILKKAVESKSEWNSNFTDLNAYKLSETELVRLLLKQMRRKAERTSKNHIQAKNDWKSKIEKLETGEITVKEVKENLRPKGHPLTSHRKRSSRPN